MTALKIAVIDDDPGVRDGLSAVLSALQHDASFFESADQFRLTATATNFDCIVLDLMMPGMNGIELLRLLVDNQVDTPVIMMSAVDDLQSAFQAGELGAVTFMPKPIRAMPLDAAIKKAIARRDQQRFVHTQRLSETVAPEKLARLEQITPAERKVLLLLVEDKSSKEIARNLAISDRTVESHRRNIYKKLGTNSLLEIYKQVKAAGWIGTGT